MQSIIFRIIILLAILSVPTLAIYKDYAGRSLELPPEPEDQVVIEEHSGPEPIIEIIPVESADMDKNSPEVSSKAKKVIKGALPSLDKPWSYPSDFSGEAKRIIEERVATLNSSLKSDPDQYDQWVDLGVLRKVVGDYEEAKNIWEFSALNWPDSLVAFHNLGDIYHYYLKDYSKAEKNMLRVIEIDPAYIPEYSLISELYKRLYGAEDERVIAILKRGLESNPKSVDLMISIASIYKTNKDSDNARKYYEMALTRARELKNVVLQRSMEDEISSLGS